MFSNEFQVRPGGSTKSFITWKWIISLLPFVFNVFLMYFRISCETHSDSCWGPGCSRKKTYCPACSGSFPASTHPIQNIKARHEKVISRDTSKTCKTGRHQQNSRLGIMVSSDRKLGFTFKLLELKHGFIFTLCLSICNLSKSTSHRQMSHRHAYCQLFMCCNIESVVFGECSLKTVTELTSNKETNQTLHQLLLFTSIQLMHNLYYSWEQYE